MKLAGLLNEERNMYGDIVDPAYYIEISSRKGPVSERGPFDSESEAREELLSLLPNSNSRDYWSPEEVPGIEKLDSHRWYSKSEETEYAIVERESLDSEQTEF